MKILITGATGLIGSYIAKRFTSLGEIYALRRKSANKTLLDDNNVTWLEGDVTDYQSLESAFEGMDMVIHVAGLVSYEKKDSKDLMKVNLEGTTNVVNVMLQMKIKKLIHISSVAALGRTPDIKLIDENHKWATSDLNTPYAISKYLGELEVWRAAQEGLDVIVVYPSVALGKISDGRSSTAIYNYVLEEKPYYPSGIINYIDVRDLADIVALLYEKQVWGSRYILNADAIPYKEFFEEIALAFDKKAPNKSINPSSLRVFLTLSWIAYSVGLSKIPLNPITAKLAQLPHKMSNSKIKKELGFEFRPLSQTLKWAKMNEI
ncbi:SDR family NAD(P)-dependent oxidoreductase [Belliella sp. R4-6]|uniref:SDR family NAD(P)-dependent oxidoreductase n=1 Tax=Belliella alkalica TaxID=1730871 RepID=A0ABS9VH51_9BACT|nr:SDR family NAD(P)-dependent oxidoreductase [Belliella alkalica]MCH7415782.1 SDR family NAD(P)-dependent oxidoreductase [Belliella alkalica]